MSNLAITKYAGFVALSHELGAEGCLKKLEEMRGDPDRELFKHASFMVRYSVDPMRLKDILDETNAAAKIVIDVDYAKIEKNLLKELGDA